MTFGILMQIFYDGPSDGYSIIGQGNIANVLSQKSEDRRTIFEEAAGISKYKYKKIRFFSS